jgi:hypothetical protein
MNLTNKPTALLNNIEKRCRKKRALGWDYLRWGFIADRCAVELNKRIIEKRHEWKI